MEQYIPKAALAAEIEKLIEIAKAERVLHPKTILAAKNYLLIEDYKKLLSFLDTFKVKEVDSNDAFIEKACEWLNNFYNKDTHSYLIDEDIKKFVDYMKGE